MLSFRHQIQLSSAGKEKQLTVVVVYHYLMVTKAKYESVCLGMANIYENQSSLNKKKKKKKKIKTKAVKTKQSY